MDYLMTLSVIASKGVVINEDKFEFIWKKLIVSCVKVLSWNSAGETEENHEKPLENNRCSYQHWNGVPPDTSQNATHLIQLTRFKEEISLRTEARKIR
jgi:hypothetical protein